MADKRDKASHAAAGGNRAFTLLELVVAVAIISVMVLGFSGLLGGARRVVITSQRRMRANAAAAATAAVIRNDMRRASKAGFLRIAGDSIIFTTAGPTASVLSGHKGDGAMISYGRYPDDNILYRQGWVLAEGGTGLDCTAPKDWPETLADLQILSSEEMDALAEAVFKAPPDTATIGSPPKTLAQLTGMWQVLADNCTALEIHYHSAGGGWTSPTETQTWKRHDQINWPDAVRFKLTISSGAVAEILEQTNTYEVICPVGP